MKVIKVFRFVYITHRTKSLKMAERFLIGETTAPKGVAVPENLTKKVERNAALLKQKTAALAEMKKANKVKRHDMKMRASKYEKQYRTDKAQLIAQRRLAKATGTFLSNKHRHHFELSGCKT